MRADKIKRAIADIAFERFAEEHLFVARNSEPGALCDGLPMEVIESGDLYRVVRIKVGNEYREFEIRMKERDLKRRRSI